MNPKEDDTSSSTAHNALKAYLKMVEGKREVGSIAVWSISSCKPGFGVEQLRDNNLETYWQSDASQPHTISIQFTQKQLVSDILLYVDYKQDESYTPHKISVRAGSNFNDLHEINSFTFDEPVGWINLSFGEENQAPQFKAHFVQLAIISNHQNGKDTHIRQVKIFSPSGQLTEETPSSLEFSMYSVIR